MSQPYQQNPQYPGGAPQQYPGGAPQPYQSGTSQPYQGGMPQPYQGGQVAYAQSQQPALAGLQMKRRNPVGAWLGLPLITFGIYGLVWIYSVHAELAAFDRRRPINPGMALCAQLFGFITLGIWPLVMWIKLGGHIQNAQRAAGLQPTCSGGVGFLLGIFGFGVLYYQIQLNKVIDRYGDAPTGAQVPLAA